MKYWVYVHTCPNGKKYVGCTGQERPEHRWGKDGAGYNTQLFGKAILKYGWDNITHEVFEVESEEEMYRKEVELISFFHSNDPQYGYNCSSGGEVSSKGSKRSEEICKHLSEVSKGKPKPWLRGRILSKETRNKISEAHKGHLASEETRKRMSEGGRKKWEDPEHKKRMFEARKGHLVSEETRKKISESRKGIPQSEEARKKISEAMKNRPRFRVILPDGTERIMTKSNIAKIYLNRGINVTIECI